MIVLDSSALLVSLFGETGAHAVDLLLETQSCAMSVVNVAEVHERLLEAGARHREAHDIVDELKVQVLPFERLDAEFTASLRRLTRHAGLGIADRACIATGMRRDAAIATADSSWRRIDIEDADIRFVR